MRLPPGDETGKADAAGRPFNVLAVCTGNICRSPATERLLRAQFADVAGFEISSAGTNALAGYGIAPPMAALLAERGADPRGFVARSVTEELIAQADLILALTRNHRSAAASLYPSALRRIVTLRELARLAREVDRSALATAAAGPAPADRLAALLPLAVARRGHRPAEPREDDVVDPWRRSEAVYRESMRQITEAVELITDAITG